MVDKTAIPQAITKAKGRKCLYHFTRVRNLPSIAILDELLSSFTIYPDAAGERRTEKKENFEDDLSRTINAHLKIADSMFEADCTQEVFRAYLDRHIFFWPTIRHCRKMVDTYKRREPNEAFAVLELDAYSLLLDHYAAVKLSKYDSGSSPRFPKSCNYKKSLNMFLPLDQFKSIVNNTVPTKGAEIHEVLIEDKVERLSKYLRTVHVDDGIEVPEKWSDCVSPLSTFGETFK